MIQMIVALVIFAITYVLIMTEWINKMTAALMGGFLVIAFHIVGQKRAFAAVDWNVIFLLIGMMMVMAVLRETGIFQYIAIKTAKLAKASPVRIMLFMFAITALISAFLDNVTTVMMLVPIALLIASELKISPIPFVITMAIASNIGGTATMIGDPPNILIGSANHLTFMDFIINLTPVILIITAVSILILYFSYRHRMQVSNQRRAKIMEYKEKNLITNKKLLLRAVIVMTVLMTGFVLQDTLHLHSATIAMTAALILLIMSNRKEVDHIITQSVDWVSILFFIGLFMIVGGLNEAGVMRETAPIIVRVTRGDFRIASLAMIWFSGIMSSILGSVPFVAAMIPMIKHMAPSFGVQSMDPMWWSLALGACLGGNGTIIGAAANIVSIGIARKNGYKISFWQYIRYAFVITITSLIISTLYIYLRYFLF